MMSENRYCMFLCLCAVAGLISVSGAGITVKYACQGESVQVFQNIEFNHCNANVSLHINGDRNAEIAVWSIHNCIRNETIVHDYQRRLIFDQYGTITIQNFDYFDQAKYVLISKMDPLPKIYEVQLYLIVVPSKACKPMIEQLGNSLIASVNAKDCGKPLAIPYWKDYDNVFNTNEPMLKLIPGMEAKEYYACIKGVALRCVINVTLHDYCTTFKTEGKNMNEEQETVLLVNSKLLRKWKKHFGKLKWADISTLLNDDQRNGFRAYFDNLILQSNNPRQDTERQGDVAHNREEASTEQQICNDPDKIKELLELRDAVLCKICLARKMSVFFLPCTHMATCTECSISLAHCPICRAETKQKLTICFD